MNHFDIHSNIHCVTSCMTGPAVGYFRSWRKSDESNIEGERQEISAEMALCMPTEAAGPMKDDRKNRASKTVMTFLETRNSWPSFL